MRSDADFFKRLIPLVKQGRNSIEQAYNLGALAAEYTDGAPDGPASLRDLARRVDGHLTVSSLSRALGVYQLCSRAPRWRDAGLSLSHLVAVLPLAPELQDALLSLAKSERWTVRKLRNAAARSSSAATTERQTLPPPADPTTALEDLLRHVVDARDDLDGAEPDPAERRRLLLTIKRIRKFCDDVERSRLR